jgi:S1-C subfamily serine protease/WD40 repeat protein
MQAKLLRRMSAFAAIALFSCVFGCGSGTSITDAVKAATKAIEVRKKVNGMDAEARRFMHKVIDEAEQKVREGDFFLDKDKYKEAVQAYDQCAALYRQALDGGKLLGRLKYAQTRVTHLRLLAELMGALQEKEELEKAENRAKEYIEASDLDRAVAELETVCKAVFPKISKNDATREQAEAARDSLQNTLRQIGRLPPATSIQIEGAIFAAVEELDNKQYALAQALFQAAEKLCREGALKNPKIEPKPTYAGAALVVNPDGYLVTAFHIVAGASQVTVKLRNDTHVAKIVATDKTNDLAILKIDANALPFAPLQETRPVDGTIVTVFGSGLTANGVEEPSTRTGKIVSAPDEGGPLCLDCPLNPGFTGGPVVTAQGNAIGLVTAKLASVDVLHGSRAIPMSHILALLRANGIPFTAAIPAGPFDGDVLYQRILPAVGFVTIQSQKSDGSVWRPTKPTILWSAPWEYEFRSNRLAVSPNGQVIATARTLRDKPEIELRDAKGNVQKVLTGHKGSINNLAFSHDSLVLASSSSLEIMLWDAQSGLLLKPLGDNSGEVRQIAFSGDNQLLAARCGYGTVRVLDVKTGQLLQTISPNFFADCVSDMVFFPGTETLLVCGNALYYNDNCIRLYHARSGKCLRSITPKHIFPDRYPAEKPGYNRPAGGDCMWFVLSPDGRMAAFYFHDAHRKIVLARTSDFRPIQEVSPLWQTHTYSFSPDGTIFAIGGAFRLLVDAVTLYHVKTGALAWNLIGEGGRRFVFTPDGKGILRDADNALVRWDISFLGLGPCGQPDLGALDELLASGLKPADPASTASGTHSPAVPPGMPPRAMPPGQQPEHGQLSGAWQTSNGAEFLLKDDGAKVIFELTKINSQTLKAVTGILNRNAKKPNNLAGTFQVVFSVTPNNSKTVHASAVLEDEDRLTLIFSDWPVLDKKGKQLRSNTLKHVLTRSQSLEEKKE